MLLVSEESSHSSSLPRPANRTARGLVDRDGCDGRGRHDIKVTAESSLDSQCHVSPSASLAKEGLTRRKGTGLGLDEHNKKRSRRRRRQHW
ncbi:unnamed protein product, partial [Amoebophrya sp. A25]|eukprot:GSA25T00003721001.1